MGLGLQLFLAQRDRSFRCDRLRGTHIPTVIRVCRSIPRECVSARVCGVKYRAVRRTVGRTEARFSGHELLVGNKLRAFETNEVIHILG